MSSFAALAVHRVEENRFVFLMADLEHPIGDLAELFKTELRQVRANLPRSRKRLDKVEKYLLCWDFATREMTLSEIAEKVYPDEWRTLPAKMEFSIPELTPKEIETRAKALRQKGLYAYSWSFKQAREELTEERIKQLTGNKTSAEKALNGALRIRQTLRQRVWRNIQTAHRRIEAMTPKTRPTT